jgi:hypothetical protein
VLEYLVKGRARRELFRLLWGRRAVGSVSELARLAQVPFSAAHRELSGMREAGLAQAERVRGELVYRADVEHTHSKLLRDLAQSGTESDRKRRLDRDGQLRAWLARLGAPLGAPDPKGSAPASEEVLAEALSLSHRDASVARVLPLVLWRQRARVDLDRLREEATRRDERQALGYFLELAGQLGGERRLAEAARELRDRRRKRARMFFSGPKGPRALAATRRNTPKQALRWGFLMNLGVDSFRSVFDKSA